MFLVRFVLAAISACLVRAMVLPCTVTLTSKHGSVTSKTATNCTFYFQVAKNRSLTVRINTNRNFTFPYWENVSANSSQFAHANGSCVTFRWPGSTCGRSQCDDVIGLGPITSSQVGITFVESPTNETISFSYNVTECPSPPMTTTKPTTAPNDVIIGIGVGVAVGALFLLLLIVVVIRILLKKSRKVTPTNGANHRDTTEGNSSRDETVEITDMPPPDPDVRKVEIEPQEGTAVQQATYINVTGDSPDDTKEAIYVNEHVTDDDAADSDNAGFYEEPIPMTSRANGQEDPTYMNMRDLS